VNTVMNIWFPWKHGISWSIE